MEVYLMGRLLSPATSRYIYIFLLYRDMISGTRIIYYMRAELTLITILIFDAMSRCALHLTLKASVEMTAQVGITTAVDGARLLPSAKCCYRRMVSVLVLSLAGF